MNQLAEASLRLANIERYEAGESSIAGRSGSLKLSSNENPFGPGRRAREALSQSLGELERYPSGNHYELRAAIADVHGLDAGRILCGAGSDNILSLLARAFSGPGTEVICARHGFLMYPIFAKAAGATPVEVAETDRKVDVGKILAAVSDRTRLIYIANPSNPTGTMLDNEELENLAAELPASVVLALDGAYAEYAEGYDGGASLVDRYPNVFMTRTFSKIHGLAALRVGYGYGAPDIVNVLDRIREPFNVGGPAQAAAIAAIGDADHVRNCQAENARNREWLAGRLAPLGIDVDRSHANFILARFSSPDQAAACDGHLRDEGIIVRRLEAYKLSDCLRITIGDRDSCQRVSEAISRFAGDWSGS